MSETKQPQQPAAKVSPFVAIGEVVIEIGDDRNRRVLYPGTRTELRGWWKKSNLLGITMKQEMTQMPDLPGAYVCLDCRRGRLRILDPLSAPENKAVLAQAKAIHKELWRENAGPNEDVIKDGLNDTEMKTNLYWMSRLVNVGSARVVSGNLPTLEEIEALPGMTSTEVWNSSARARKYREESEDDVASRNQAAVRW